MILYRPICTCFSFLLRYEIACEKNLSFGVDIDFGKKFHSEVAALLKDANESSETVKQLNKHGKTGDAIDACNPLSVMLLGMILGEILKIVLFPYALISILELEAFLEVCFS